MDSCLRERHQECCEDDSVDSNASLRDHAAPAKRGFMVVYPLEFVYSATFVTN
jgi:hypothetical protein